MRRGHRLRLDIAYNGREFHGWQIQPAARTVQGELRDYLTRLLGRPVTPVGAGRTDAGVNARGQTAHLTVATDDEVERIMRALPRMMPDDIDIRAVRRVSHDFNARFSATSRSYSYNILLVRDIFRPLSWHVFRPLDRAVLDAGAGAFCGAHDFTSFCKASSLKTNTNICEVSHCAFEWRDDSAIFRVHANRFLHHMVRNMLGTLIEIGVGERDNDIPEILAARSRSAAGKMAPAAGLFLDEVTYPEELMDPEFNATAPGEGDEP